MVPQHEGGHTGSAARWRRWAAWTLVLVTALALRLPALTAGLPYLTYVDEGHVLHHVSRLLAARSWEPSTYSYPSLPFYLTAGATLAWAPVYGAVHGRALCGALSPDPPRLYDVVEPVDLLVVGRLVTLAFALALVLLTGLLARRVVGDAAGLWAAWLAAWVPALVARSAVVNVNPQAACFAVAALLAAEGAREGARPRRAAALAGALAGLAGASKYPLALVALPVALAVLWSEAPARERLRRLLLAAASALLAAVVAMPALLLRPQGVLGGLREMDGVYARQAYGSYFEQAFRRAEGSLPFEGPELGFVLVGLAVAGAAFGLRERRWRRPVAGWLLFAAATFALVAPYRFRAFRNLLPLVPIACALAGLAFGWLRSRLDAGGPLVRRALALAALLLPLLLYGPAMLRYERHELRLVDSRDRALRWLARHVPPGKRVLVAEELAFPPARLAALRDRRLDVLPWARLRESLAAQRPPWVVAGDPVPGAPGMDDPALQRVLAEEYRPAARFGSYRTNLAPQYFNGNDQFVTVLRRRVRPGRPRSPGRATPG